MACSIDFARQVAWLILAMSLLMSLLGIGTVRGQALPLD